MEIDNKKRLEETVRGLIEKAIGYMECPIFATACLNRVLQIYSENLGVCSRETDRDFSKMLFEFAEKYPKGTKHFLN